MADEENWRDLKTQKKFRILFEGGAKYQKYQKLLQPEKNKLKIQSKRVLGCTKIHTLASES